MLLKLKDGMRLVLLHYHILKNGGSSIEEILRRSFCETFLTFDLPHRDAEIKPPDLLAFLDRYPRVNAFSSHQIFYPVPQAPGFLFFDICFLRDPIDRIRSIYDYFRGKPADGDPIRELANQHTLADFTRRMVEEMPWTVNDVQVNLLANGLVNDQPRGVEDLEIATARMLETSFLGVVDRFNESLVASHKLNALFPGLNCVQAPVNDSAAPGSTMAERIEQFRNACDAGVYAELLRLNAMDFKLLRRAREEVRRRFELLPDREERLRGLKEGVSILIARGDNADAPKPAPAPSAPVNRKPRPAPSSCEPGVFTRLMRRLRFAMHLRAMKPGSEFRRLFDADYYREVYPDAANPLRHFITTGAFEGRNPHPLFDTNFYLSQCTQPPRINALLDYLERDDVHGPRPHPLFDPAYYVRRYPDVVVTRMNPLAHYILHGAAEGRKPHPLFQPEYYLTVCAAARNAKNPLVHFVESEGDACCNPHPLFGCASYLSAHPEISGNPLVAYLTRPARLPKSFESAVGRLEAARFAIQDVEILAVFPGSGFDACPETEQRRIFEAVQARADLSVEAALVWRDGSGQKKFLCAPQQRPFFELARYDQLAAQINGTL